MNNPIGILDSGVGGLSVWREIVRLLPSESIIYLADSKNVPYGTKSSEEIYSLAKRLLAFLQTQNVKLIVVACNTITVSALELLRKDYPDIPIIGTVPVVKTAAEKTRNNHIGILSTLQTAKSEYQENLIKKYAHNVTVTNIGCDKLVPLIELGIIDGEKVESALSEDVAVFKNNNIDTLALGCTHYPFIKPTIQKLLGENVMILDSGAAIARHVQRIIEHNGIKNDIGNVQQSFYTTGDQHTFSKVAKKLLGSTIQVEHIKL